MAALVHLSFRDFLLDNEMSRELPLEVEELTMHRADPNKASANPLIPDRDTAAMVTSSTATQSLASSAPRNNAPIVDDNPALLSYYNSFESRIGWGVVTNGTRHAGYWEHDTKWPFPLSAAFRRMEARLFTTLALPPGSRVLDAGCGDSQVAIHLASKGLFVTGIDVVPRHLENSWRNIRKSGLPAGMVEVQYADYHHLEHVPSESFDGVYTVETLLHATDPAAVLAGFYRVLKPGGRLVLHEGEHPDTGAADLEKQRAETNEHAAMPTCQASTTGFYLRLVEDAGFAAVGQEDLTAKVRPLARLFYCIALVPYYLIVLLLLE
ncbi:methyltransferase domain-containing protein, partial [Candidatus Bathyarchaeota archaeon]|nr:methyltransferase domain-containing protein [Candidatus Bathyarchaeota archaeon]